MPKTLSIAVAAAFIFSAAPALSQGSKGATTGTEFLAVCAQPDEAAAAFCEGYVQAVFDSGHREGASLCVPAAAKRAKMVSAVVEVLRARPELQSHNAGVIVFAIMSELYPCP